MSQASRFLVTGLLAVLTALDIAYALIAFALPEFWFEQMHGMDYVDPAGLFRRTGALWAAFALLQGIALFRWRRAPHWLMLVVGVRLTELFADWVYLGFANHVETASAIGLAASPVLNLACAAFFYWAYFKAQSR